MTKTGSGTLTLAGANNSLTGGISLSSGGLNLINPAALGYGSFTINGGSIANTSSAAVALFTGTAQNWNGNFTFSGSNDLNLGSGAVTLSSSRTVTVASNALTVGGIISDGGNGYSLTKAGTGTLILGGLNAYTGGTTISAGTLQLNNARAVQHSTVTVAVDNGLAFGPGIAAPILGGLAGSGNVNLATTDASPLPVVMTVGGDNANTTYSAR